MGADNVDNGETLNKSKGKGGKKEGKNRRDKKGKGKGHGKHDRKGEQKSSRSSSDRKQEAAIRAGMVAWSKEVTGASVDSTGTHVAAESGATEASTAEPSKPAEIQRAPLEMQLNNKELLKRRRDRSRSRSRQKRRIDAGQLNEMMSNL